MKSKNAYYRILPWVMCAILTSLSTRSTVSAAGADPTEMLAMVGQLNAEAENSDTENQETADAEMVSEPFEIPEIPKTQQYQYFYFDITRVLKGVYGSAELYFSLPEYWETRFVYVGVSYEVSRLITGEVPASLTFLVNGTPVYSCSVSYNEGKEQTAYFTIPVSLLTAGYNLLEATSYVKIFNTEGCTEDLSWSNWVNIDGDSYMYVGYDLADTQNKISYYPYPFLSSLNPSGEGIGISVSDAAANGELSAALYLLSGLSSQTEEENKISFGRYSRMQDKKITNQILVSLTGNLPSGLKRYLLSDPADTAPGAAAYDLSTQAMVRFLRDEKGNPMLLIVADGEENLMEAVFMLLDGERVSQEKSDTAFIREGSAKQVYDSRQLSQLVAGRYTIKDIAGRGMTFIGPFHSEQYLYLPFGSDYVLSSAGKMLIKFRYSDNLDFNRSLITVYWGDIPVASKKLTRENAGSDELTITMPSDVVGTSASSIKIAFDLEIADLFCTLRQEEMPWAYVTEDSTLYLPSVENTEISFGHLPSPYQKQNIFQDVLVVVDDIMDSAELELLGRAVAACGTGISPYGSLQVIRADEFNEADADYNIITVGTLDNPFLARLNQDLYFQLNTEGTAFESNSRLVLSESYAKDIAAFQLLESPFAPQRAVFTVSGTGEATLEQAIEFLQVNANRLKLSGDCVLVDSDQELKSFTFIEHDGDEIRPNVQEFISKNKQPLLFTVMAASAMVMLLTAAILILARARGHKKREDKES